MSASKAKILSSFSRRCSINAVVLYSGPVEFCEPPVLCAEKIETEEMFILIRVAVYSQATWELFGQDKISGCVC